jgi:hypothetical protein
MKTIKVIIEHGTDGFSAYAVNKFDDFALFGFGDSIENTIDDFKIAYNEIKTSLDNVPELQFKFYYNRDEVVQKSSPPYHKFKQNRSVLQPN